MALVLIHASAPWGPVSFRTADGMGEVLAWGQAPAAVVDVGERDPADVAREVLQWLPPPDATGLIPVTLDRARNSVAEAASRVPATMVVAETPEIAVLGHPAAIAEDVEGARDGGAAGISSEMSADERIEARVRRRPGAEVDVRAIRVGLGMSQAEFAGAYGIPLATLRDWEQGRRSPDGAGRSLLVLIERFPVRARRALEESGVAVEA